MYFLCIYPDFTDYVLRNSNSIKTTVSTTSVTLMSSSNWFDFFPSYLHLCWALKYVSQGMGSKNDFSTWRIVSYAWSLSTSYYLLILKWKKLKRYCFLVEKVLLFIKKYCRKKVLSKGIRPLDTVYIANVRTRPTLLTTYRVNKMG